MSKVYVIHENDDWSAPLFKELETLGTPYESWFLDEGELDLSEVPPEGVFYNRMSASSHTRGHRFAPEYTQSVLAWLQRHDRSVLNGGACAYLEYSKVSQYQVLERHGVKTPKTIATIGRDALVNAARKFEGQFITKHNRAGKGLGVRLFDSQAALARYVDSDDFEVPVDGITLVQQYIKAPKPFITRVEFVGQELLYAVRVDTSEGFELCPADVCAIDDKFCPTTETPKESAPRFEVLSDFQHPLVARYLEVMRHHDMDIVAFEFIEDESGEAYTYDINMNVNYNQEAEGRIGADVSGMRAIARLLTGRLGSVSNA